MDLYQFIIALGSLGTLGTVLIIFFIQIIKPWLNEPLIIIDFAQKEPFCKEVNWLFLKDQQGNNLTTPSYWIRVKVRNEGDSIAENCEGQLIEVSDDRGNIIEKYVPLILSWASRPKQAPIDISKGASWFLDVIFVNKDNSNVRNIFGTTFSKKVHICDIFRGNPTGTFQDFKAGKYYFKIMIYGDNFKPTTKKLYVNWDGKWKIHGRDSIIVRLR